MHEFSRVEARRWDAWTAREPVTARKTLRPNSDHSNKEKLMRLFAPGERVLQPQYGHGTVTKSDEYHTWIDFDEHGPRMFSTSRCQLEASETIAPVKPARSKRKANRATARQ